jgi:hypothetical protein
MMSIRAQETYGSLPSPHKLMDCRVKPGNDKEESDARKFYAFAANFSTLLTGADLATVLFGT